VRNEIGATAISENGEIAIRGDKVTRYDQTLKSTSLLAADDIILQTITLSSKETKNYRVGASITSCRFFPKHQHQYILFSVKSNNVQIFDVIQQQIVTDFLPRPLQYAISPDDQYAVSVDLEQQLSIYKIEFPQSQNIPTREIFKAKFSFNVDTIKALAISNDSKLVAIYIFKVSSLTTNERVQPSMLLVPQQKPKISIHLHVYSTKAKTNIFSEETKPLDLIGHTEQIQSITFVTSPKESNGKFIFISASYDRTVRVWNINAANVNQMSVQCVAIFNLFAGVSISSLNVIPVSDEERNQNGTYGQMIVGDLYGRVYWLQLLQKDF